MIFRPLRRLRDLVDVTFGSPSDGDALTYDSGTDSFVLTAGGGGGGGAPTTVDYLVGTASGSLSGEIVVGTAPGGELGGTWASPTVDTTHSGSSHASVQAAAEATAAAALSAHSSDTTSVHGISDTSALLDTADLGVSVQAHDADLAAIAALSPTNDDVIQRKAGAWTNRTVAQLVADMGLGSVYQPLDSDLTSIAALSTTSYGRALLALADAAALRTAAGLGSFATLSSLAADGLSDYAVATSMPGTPSTNDRVYRTDLGREFYYDGTRWLTTQQFIAPFLPQLNQAGQTFNQQLATNFDLDMWIEKAHCQMYVVTTNSGSAYWTLTLNKSDTAAASTSLGTTSSQSEAANTRLRKTITVNAALGGSATYPLVFVTNTKTGAPGNVDYVCSLVYRLIGT